MNDRLLIEDRAVAGHLLAPIIPFHAERATRGQSSRASLAEADISDDSDYAEFFRLADRVEAGFLHALIVLQGALKSAKPDEVTSDELDQAASDDHWDEIGEDYERLCALLMGGVAFARLDLLEQNRMRSLLSV